ncbi:hypothetical protein [Sinomonas terrae]|uniref:Uncharacterized protein n=1 Tax=Sinomonas terrae TaxID=2908838 RepID=A0ABS9TW21_9MICC|nr:hypothetical protein [Sinomonas terrae]MCH6468621.1 hypothetical protein [Sinomonas terrae]
MASKKQPIVHEIRDEFCITCGSNTEFFAFMGQSMVDADIREPVMVDPALVEEAVRTSRRLAAPWQPSGG